MESSIDPAAESTIGDIRCPNCGLLLARRDTSGELVVRWKELQVNIVGGDTTIHCRRCGTVREA